MYKKMLCLFIIAAISLMGISGCKEDTTTVEEVKSEAEYKAEAQKEISDENVDDALSDIEKEITGELSE